MSRESWKKYLALTRKKGRRETHKFIVEGVRSCREALISDWPVEVAYVTEEFRNSDHWAEFQEYFQQRRIPFRILARQHFRKLAETTTPQGVLLIMQHPYPDVEKISLKGKKFLLLLQGVRDPGNLGTLIRTADWFGVDVVLLSHDCVDPLNAKVIRSSMGSLFHLPVIEVEDWEQVWKALKQNNFWLVGASLNAPKVLSDLKVREPVALMLGGEAFGIPADIESQLDVLVRIWKYGQAESLNVAVAGGIFMNYIAQQISRKPKRR